MILFSGIANFKIKYHKGGTFKLIHMLRKVYLFSLEYFTSNPYPPKKDHSRRTKRGRRVQSEVSTLNPPKGKRTFKHGLENPHS